MGASAQVVVPLRSSVPVVLRVPLVVPGAPPLVSLDLALALG